MSDQTGAATPALPAHRLIDAELFAKGMAVIRIFFGLILLANGLAKIHPEFGRVDIGWYHANLITQKQSRQILNFEVNERKITKADTTQGTEVPGIKWIANEMILPHWDTFRWLITITELTAGTLLILGLATRLSALVDLLFQLFLAAVYFSSNRWMFEQPHEYLPLLVLAIVPAGRMWGLDRIIVQANRKLLRWPF